MQYIFFEFEGEKFWLELDDDNYALRQVIIKGNVDKDGNTNRQGNVAVHNVTVQSAIVHSIIMHDNLEVHVSCMEDCLAEGAVNEEDMAGAYDKISKDEFENVWNSALAFYDQSWKAIKRKYSVGDHVAGTCKYFYPQGAILQGEDFIGVYKGAKSFAVHESILAEVTGFDEENRWVVLV